MFVLLLSMCTACTNNNNAEQNQQEDNVQQIHYESKKEENERLGINDYTDKDYYQSDEEGIAHDGNERNIFHSKESLLVAQKLGKRPDIKQYQVAVYENYVIVFTILNDYVNDDIAESIEQDVKEVLPSKEVAVYTDEYHWNKMRHMQAGFKQREIADDIEHYLEENFNLNIKD